tara:strand:- start:378 stop:1088 length:711 start_codon:yes stop_codon:yes gene_type:complete
MLGLGSSLSMGSGVNESFSKQSLSLDGTGDHASGGNVDLRTTDFSISMWIKPYSFGNFVLLSQYTGAGDKFFIYINGSTGRMYWHHNNTSTNSGPSSFYNISDVGNWIHIALVVDRDVGPTFYKNGLPGDTEVYDSTASMNPGAANIRIGSYYPATSGFDFHGALDDVGIFDSILDADEILSIFQDGPDNLLAAHGDYDSQADLIHYWKFEGDADDSKGSNDLSLSGDSIFSPDTY